MLTTGCNYVYNIYYLYLYLYLKNFPATFDILAFAVHVFLKNIFLILLLLLLLIIIIFHSITTLLSLAKFLRELESDQMDLHSVRTVVQAAREDDRCDALPPVESRAEDHRAIIQYG